MVSRPALGWGIWRCSDQIRRYLNVQEVVPDGTGAWYFTGHDREGLPHNGYSDKQELRIDGQIIGHGEQLLVVAQEMREITKTIAHQDMLIGVSHPSRGAGTEQFRRALAAQAQVIANEAFDVYAVRLFNRSR